MRARQPACPIDYTKICNQTVTVYRKVGEEITRTVYEENAFFDFKKTASVDKVGTDYASSFLLVIPGNEQAVYPGDKVFLGEGPEIASVDYWVREFIPAKVNNLGVVKYADPKYWNNKMVHTEAGG